MKNSGQLKTHFQISWEVLHKHKNLTNRIIMLLNAFYTECALGIKNKIILFYRLNGIYSSISYVNIQNEHPST